MIIMIQCAVIEIGRKSDFQ